MRVQTRWRQFGARLAVENVVEELQLGCWQHFRLQLVQDRDGIAGRRSCKQDDFEELSHFQQKFVAARPFARVHRDLLQRNYEVGFWDLGERSVDQGFV